MEDTKTTVADNSADDNETHKMIKRVGNTNYDVFIHFSETSKETMTDKILRLIRSGSYGDA